MGHGIRISLLIIFAATALGAERVDVIELENGFFNSFESLSAAPLKGGVWVTTWNREVSLFDFHYTIEARLTDFDGTPLGPPFEVASGPETDFWYPDVATDRDGSFVIFWRRNSYSNGESLIQGRRFSPSGQPQGPMFDISATYRSDRLSLGRPSGAFLRNGDLAVSWFVHRRTDGAEYVEATILRGDQIRHQRIVNSDPTRPQGDPSVTALASGGFAVAWNSGKVQVQRFDDQGRAVGSRIQIEYSGRPDIAPLDSGGFVVVWDREDEDLLEGQRFGANGAPQGQRFSISSGWHDVRPKVTTLDSGDFAVVWRRGFIRSSGVVSRLFTPQAEPTTDEVLLHNGFYSGFYYDLVTAPFDEVQFFWRERDYNFGTSRLMAGRHVPPCGETDRRICLQDERFEAELKWRDSRGNVGTARAAAARSDDSGLYWFFDQSNWEMLLKVLDGCSINQSYWVFAATTSNVEYTLRITDLSSGLVKEYRNAQGNAAPALTDTAAFPCGVVDSSPSADGTEPPPTAASRSPFADSRSSPKGSLCSDDPDRLCLNEGRFEVDVVWSAAGRTERARAVPLGTDDSGLLWFFDENNWEMLVKVLDGCDLNQHYWVFAAATTNVAYTLRVTDRQTGEVRTYTNPQGNAADALTDTRAFDGCS